jgi:hypothetical protein
MQTNDMTSISPLEPRVAHIAVGFADVTVLGA